MSTIIEVYCPHPVDPSHEMGLKEQMTALGGRFHFREENAIAAVSEHVCLTFEFNNWEDSDHAAGILRAQGEHVEGPCEYGDDPKDTEQAGGCDGEKPAS